MAQSLGLSNVPHNHNLQSNSSAFFRYSSAFWMACITTTWLLDLWSHLYTELIDFCLHFYKPTSDIPASCYTNLTSFNSLLLTQTELYAISVNNYVSASGLHRNYFLPGAPMRRGGLSVWVRLYIYMYVCVCVAAKNTAVCCLTARKGRHVIALLALQFIFFGCLEL